jgi:hypothetical protein
MRFGVDSTDSEDTVSSSAQPQRPESMASLQFPGAWPKHFVWQSLGHDRPSTQAGQVGYQPSISCEQRMLTMEILRVKVERQSLRGLPDVFGP